MAKADIRRPPISYVQALLVVLGYKLTYFL